VQRDFYKSRDTFLVLNEQDTGGDTNEWDPTLNCKSNKIVILSVS